MKRNFDPIAQTKYCAGCDTVKRYEEFWAAKATASGRTVYCIPCSKKKKPKGICKKCNVESTTGVYEMCKGCSGRTRRENTQKKRSITDKGYIEIRGMQGHPNSRKNGSMFEHTLVMEQILGRPLFSHENVHHKNGVRHDNRPENLELWTSCQPPGSRVDNAIEWAIELLTQYGYQVTKE
jgi:hypothetical protein